MMIRKLGYDPISPAELQERDRVRQVYYAELEKEKNKEPIISEELKKMLVNAKKYEGQETQVKKKPTKKLRQRRVRVKYGSNR